MSMNNKRHRVFGSLISVVLILLLLCPVLTGCGLSTDGSGTTHSDQSTVTQTDSGGADSTESSGQSGTDSSASTGQSSETVIDRNGSYTTKEDVSLYLYTYGELPGNFITKKEARKLGWEGGSLEQFAPGKCIGGDYFGNNEGLLPDDEEYHECDIDTLGAKNRGAKRLVYSDEHIYYTEDHYQHFELLYGEED